MINRLLLKWFSDELLEQIGRMITGVEARVSLNSETKEMILCRSKQGTGCEHKISFS